MRYLLGATLGEPGWFGALDTCLGPIQVGRLREAELQRTPCWPPRSPALHRQVAKLYAKAAGPEAIASGRAASGDLVMQVDGPRATQSGLGDRKRLESTVREFNGTD